MPEQIIQRKFFFDTVRRELFGGKLKDEQVEGLIEILKEYERRQLKDERWLAYILSTIFWETDKTMQPIEEYGKGHGRKYGKKFRINGQPYITPDHIFYGRGHTMNTWIDNYERLTRAAKRNGYDWDFVNHPELLLQMQPSIWVTFHAMINGLYTGKSLSDYFDTDTTDWVGGRKIINGIDKAEHIAEIAQKFLPAIHLMPSEPIIPN